jgi:AcrR family transcriptional regulator
VAKRAGISKRTFYHRFNGKEMLFEAVVRRLIERWTPSFDTALLEAPSLAEGLRRTAEHMLRIALTPDALALHRMVIAEARRFPAAARVLHELGAAAGIGRLARHIETHREWRDPGNRSALRAPSSSSAHGGDRAAAASARLGAPLTTAGAQRVDRRDDQGVLHGCGGGR